MRLTISNSRPAVKLGLTRLERLAQALELFMATPKGSVPLDRSLGLDWSMVDSPAGGMLPVLIGRVGRDIEKYYPMIRFVGLSMQNPGLDQAGDGVAMPLITVEIREEYRDEYK